MKKESKKIYILIISLLILFLPVILQFAKHPTYNPFDTVIKVIFYLYIIVIACYIIYLHTKDITTYKLYKKFDSAKRINLDNKFIYFSIMSIFIFSLFINIAYFLEGEYLDITFLILVFINYNNLISFHSFFIIGNKYIIYNDREIRTEEVRNYKITDKGKGKIITFLLKNEDNITINQKFKDKKKIKEITDLLESKGINLLKSE